MPALPSPPRKPAVRVFCCYACGDKEDEPLFASLDRQLHTLRKAGLMTTWSRHDLKGGANTEQEVRQQLASSDVVLLLVSPSLQVSECWDLDVQLALDRRRAGLCELVPVRVRPVLWNLMPFADLQPLPRHFEAVTKAPTLDDGWIDVLSGLQVVLERVMEKPGGTAVAARESGPLGLATYFQAVTDKINVLGDYKQLHDRLHQLQFQVYNVLVVESRRYPSDEVAADNLLTYQEILRDIIGEVRLLLQRPTFTGREQGWLTRLLEAQQTLEKALTDRSLELLKATIRLLRRILVREPSLINRSLTEAAHLLRMDVSATRLAQVLPAYPQLLAGEPARHWERGLNQLSGSTTALDRLVQEHDQWQSVIDLLWTLESAFGKDLSEFAEAWPDLRAPVKSLLSGSDEDWAKDLKIRTDEIDLALAKQDALAMRRAFALYSRRANLRFFQVDTQLREQCEQLRTTAAELLQTLKQVVQS